MRRFVFALVGLLLVGLGVIGAILPGLPTTIFLIGASWCFARSCPWLEERLLKARIFRPFRGYMEPGGHVSPRAKGWSIAVMWTAISISAYFFCAGEEPMHWLAGLIVGLGGIGTWFIVRHGNGRPDAEPTPEAPDPSATPPR